MRIFDAINEIIARAGKEISIVLIEPQGGEDLVIRPDIPQFNKNIVDQTRIPVIKVSSSNNIQDTHTFEHIQAAHGMYIWAFYDMEKPAIYTMTSGPIVASVDSNTTTS